jgi:hypothetical protein
VCTGEGEAEEGGLDEEEDGGEGEGGLLVPGEDGD